MLLVLGVLNDNVFCVEAKCWIEHKVYPSEGVEPVDEVVPECAEIICSHGDGVFIFSSVGIQKLKELHCRLLDHDAKADWNDASM